MKKATPASAKRSAPKSSAAATPGSAKLNQATSDEFDREGLGVAPKE